MENHAPKDLTGWIEGWVEAGLDVFVRLNRAFFGMIVTPQRTLLEASEPEGGGRLATKGLFASLACILLAIVFPALDSRAFDVSSRVLRSIFEDASGDLSVAIGALTMGVVSHSLSTWSAERLAGDDVDLARRLQRGLSYVITMQLFGFLVLLASGVGIVGVQSTRAELDPRALALGAVCLGALLGVGVRSLVATRGWLGQLEGLKQSRTTHALFGAYAVPLMAVTVGFTAFYVVDLLEPIPRDVSAHPLGEVVLKDGRLEGRLLIGNHGNDILLVGRDAVKMEVGLDGQVQAVEVQVHHHDKADERWIQLPPEDALVLRLAGPLPPELTDAAKACESCSIETRYEVTLASDRGPVVREFIAHNVPASHGTQDKAKPSSPSSE